MEMPQSGDSSHSMVLRVSACAQPGIHPSIHPSITALVPLTSKTPWIDLASGTTLHRERLVKAKPDCAPAGVPISHWQWAHFWRFLPLSVQVQGRAVPWPCHQEGTRGPWQYSDSARPNGTCLQKQLRGEGSSSDTCYFL